MDVRDVKGLDVVARTAAYHGLTGNYLVMEIRLMDRMGEEVQRYEKEVPNGSVVGMGQELSRIFARYPYLDAVTIDVER